MYSFEEKMKAVMLFIESNLSERIVFRTLGYPSPNALRNWYKEYQQTGRLNEHRKQVVKFNEKQKEFAVNHFLENGRNLTKNQAAFQTDESIYKIMYLATNNASKKWTMPIRNWGVAVNQFSILFEGRVDL